MPLRRAGPSRTPIGTRCASGALARSWVGLRTSQKSRAILAVPALHVERCLLDVDWRTDGRLQRLRDRGLVEGVLPRLAGDLRPPGGRLRPAEAHIAHRAGDLVLRHPGVRRP
eukprot:6331150-Alexandrium_andersonii.AAC.1